MATDIVTTQPEEKALTKITNYMESSVVRARFAQIMGERGASTYISSVLIAVADSYSLQKCAPASIYTSALRAATLRLSVDPGTGQAYLVPYKGQAKLIVGYKGLIDMAVRTNRYRYINASEIFEGQEVIHDQITGFHKIAGRRTGDKVIGWIAAFEMLPRFGQYSKTLYMTLEEIHAHGKRYSKSYSDKDSVWQTDPPAMEKKTVLRMLLRKWGYIDPADVRELEALENDEPETIDALNVIAASAETQRAPEVPTNREATVAALMGTSNPDPIKDATWAEFQKWRARGVTVHIDVPEITRGDHTESDLRAYIAGDLSRMILDAESQAEAGEASQEQLI
jgi:recombination protein RecT